MTLGQIKTRYPNVRGIQADLEGLPKQPRASVKIVDDGFYHFNYLLDRYGEDHLFEDYVEEVYWPGDYSGQWNHYVDEQGVINI